MNIEKSNLKIYKIIALFVLGAILLTAFGGFMMQRQTIPLHDRSTDVSRGDNPMMQPETAQSGPTGKLVVSTGILLLLFGFGVFVVLFWAGRNLYRNPS